MKYLSRVLMILFIVFSGYQINAQTVGIKGGLNLSNMLEKDDDETFSDDYKMNPGFHIGLSVDIPFNKSLSLEPGLLLTTKGMKYEDDYLGVDISAKAILYYLELPLTIKASQDLGGGSKIFGAVGPYVGLGLSGKVMATAEYQGQEETEEEKVKWGNDKDKDDLKRLDMGLTFGAGVEISSILIGISYDLGLSNNSPYQDNGATSKNRVLKFSIGYRF
ncbi:MAG: PorT family protein [Bacteroidales bacterium]|nr:PorT family protein [Bacteroidales bacterium]